MSDAAVATIVTGLVTTTTVIVGFLTMWVKLKYGVESKIDRNTELTQVGTDNAAANAKAAVGAANVAAEKAVATEDRIATMLNGALDARIRAVVKECLDPLEAGMAEVRALVDELKGLTKQNNGEK